jgi:predicted CopG family antitoxin
MKNIKITVPDDVYNKLNTLQSYYGATNLSNLFVLCTDTLGWIKKQTDSKKAVLAMTRERNTLTYEVIPIKKITEIGVDVKKILTVGG